MSESEIKQQVRQFYDRVGWQVVSDGMYQNARYEDLRPVSRGYIHRCHLRVKQFLKPAGRFLLDAGSGPIQYPEYLTYSEGYAYRVCVDLSIVALQEARRRIGEKGLFVVADIANLPFKPDAFTGVVSMHTIHHLPDQDHQKAYCELYRVLEPASSAVVVNGWSVSPLMRRLNWMVRIMDKVLSFMARWQKPVAAGAESSRVPAVSAAPEAIASQNKAEPIGTYVQTYNAAWLESQLRGKVPFEIRSWRCVSTRFLRAVIQPWSGGRLWLRLVYWLEDRFPHYLGRNGQYPLIILRKPEREWSGNGLER
jgi:SAM-dependent methyltransferase